MTPERIVLAGSLIMALIVIAFMAFPVPRPGGANTLASAPTEPATPAPSPTATPAPVPPTPAAKADAPAATSTAAATATPSETPAPTTGASAGLSAVALKPIKNAAGDCVANTSYVLGPRDVVLGSNDAPLTIIEYASMTCPHCAHLHEAVLPTIKTNYVDKGLARYVFREFPLDQVALAASVLTRCVSKEAYHPFLATLFAQQRTWAGSQDIRGELQKLASRAGMSNADFDTCLKNSKEAQAVAASRQEGLDLYCVAGTPTTILNGRVLQGEETATVEAFDKVLQAELAKLGKGGKAPAPTETKPAP